MLLTTKVNLVKTLFTQLHTKKGDYCMVLTALDRQPLYRLQCTLQSDTNTHNPSHNFSCNNYHMKVLPPPLWIAIMQKTLVHETKLTVTFNLTFTNCGQGELLQQFVRQVGNKKNKRCNRKLNGKTEQIRKQFCKYKNAPSFKLPMYLYTLTKCAYVS